MEWRLVVSILHETVIQALYDYGCVETACLFILSPVPAYILMR